MKASRRVYGGVEMRGRWLVVAAVCAAALALAGTAPAFTPLWSQPVNGAARLVAARGAMVVWAAESAGSVVLLGRAYDAAGEPLGTEPVALVDGVSGLTDWLAAPAPGGDVTLAWKSGGVTYVARRTAAGAPVYGPVAVCSDEAVAAARGAGATATPVLLLGDGGGGAYVVLQATPSQAGGDSLLTRVSAAGALATSSPGLAVAKGTVAAAAADDQDHLYVLLTGPGRNGVAVQRYNPELAADWPAPIPPYNPLAGSPSAAAQTPLTLYTAGATATAAWREGILVQLQRYTQAGERLWLRPASVEAGDDAQVAGDGDRGSYVAWAAGDGLRVRHVLGEGTVLEAAEGSSVGLGATAPRVDGVSGDQAGDLSVAFSSGGSTGGVAQMTCLGAWTLPAFTPAAAAFAALQGDGAGGAYALGSGDTARLWHLGEAGAALTLRPRAASVTYGETVKIAGYLTQDGAPIAGATVRLAPAGGPTASLVTDADGLYSTAVKPEASASWTASATGPAGQAIVSDPSPVISVAPNVSLSLGNIPSGGGYVEIFSGEVEPHHTGSQVLVQRKVGDAWKTISSGKLNGASKYRVTWRLPLVAATYLFRTVLPAHADHAAGVSRTARLRVVIGPA